MQQDHHQEQKMGCSGGAAAGGGVGGGGVLARFLSAPASASWLDALLLELDEPQPQQQQQQQRAESRSPAPPRSQTQCPLEPPELPSPSKSTAGDPTSGFPDPIFSRRNSCPPEFLARLASVSDFDSSSFADNIPTHKRPRDEESPATGSDVEMESLFQDSVPCRARAKRGFATHPRSIAERVRRTRISDRIRKLQEVVPNMDKQTNTADMLEEAVEYVKFLQKQVQDLVEHQKKCKCLGRE